MREIKFRAWDRTNKQMILEPYLHLVDGKSFFLQQKGSIPRSDLEFELMQYTGLKDKNGKEIFEGDIMWKNGVAKYEVVFSNLKAGFILSRVKNIIDIEIWSLSENGNDLEVIGNIYENPEFLK